jgi:hypothetical protein
MIKVTVTRGLCALAIAAAGLAATAAPAAAGPSHAVTGGMPGWQITLIAIGAALLAAATTLLLDRAWKARRHATATVA